MIAYDVAERARELGIRMALGADRRAIVRLVMASRMRMPAAGAAVALAAARLAGGLLFGVSPADPATYAALGAVLLAVAGGAAYVPASRAAAINPVETLR